MPLSDQELTKMLAFISMLVAFMQSDKDSPGDHIGDIENITACTKAVLELVGQAPYLLSFSFFWQGATQALLAMETQYFPDLPCETPSHLAVPRHFLPLSRVTLPSWTHIHRLIVTSLFIHAESAEVARNYILSRGPSGYLLTL